MSDIKEDEEIIEIQSFCLSERSQTPQVTTCIFRTDDINIANWCPRSITPLALTIEEVDEESTSMKRSRGDEWTAAQWGRTGARPKQYRRRRLQRLPPPSLRCPSIRPHLLRVPRLPYLLAPVHYDLVEDSYLAPIIPVTDFCFPELTVYQHRRRHVRLLDKIPELREPE